MDILRVTARWTGFTGAPGYSNFFFANDAGFWDGGIIGDATQTAVDNAAHAVYRAFGAIGSILPADATVQVETEASVLDSDSGELIGSIDVSAPESVTGSDAGGYSAASGAVVNWRTADYRFGRRIRGRTFLVPLAGSAYQSDGTLTSDALDSLRSFGDRIIEESDPSSFGVWSRPRSGAGGVFATVTQAQVPDMTAVLRSRRD